MKYLKYIIIATLGIASSFGFAPFNLLPLFFLSFAGFFYIMFSTTSKKQAFFYGYTFGAFHFIFGLSWITNALMVDAYTFATFGWLIPFFYLGTGLIFGLFFAIPALLSHYGKTNLQKIFLFASLFTIMEIAREFLLTGFPWNKVGAIWSNYPYIINSVSLFGTNGLTFLTLLIAGSLFLLIKFKENFKTFLYLSISTFLILGTLAFYNFYKTPFKTPYSNKTVKIVQSGIAQKMKWDASERNQNFLTHIELSKQGEPADFIVWSETSSPYDLKNSPNALKVATEFLNDKNYLITGYVSYDEHNIYNSLGVFNKKGLIEEYNKSHLVPFGEYIPFKKYIPLQNITNQMADLTAGDGIKTLSIGDFSFSPLICYEGIFSGKVIERDTDVDALLILTNDAWYGMSSGPYQHLVESQLRAIEEGKPVIRSGYNGISAIIDSRGKILQSLPLNTAGIIDSQIPMAKPHKTLYSQTGYYPTLAFCVFLCITLLIRLQKRKK